MDVLTTLVQRINLIKQLYILLLLSLSFGQNYSLYFSGNGHLMDIPINPIQGNSSMTYSFWLYLPDGYWGDAIIGSAGAVCNTFHLYKNEFHTRDEGCVNYHNMSISLEHNNWLYVSMVREMGVSKRLVIDGNTVASSSDPNETIYPPPIRIAQDQLGTAVHMYIDELSIWNRALTDSEISSNMYSALNGDENGLVGYWNFNEGSGINVYDQISENDGILSYDPVFGSPNFTTFLPPNPGCTHPNATNYDETANVDDGSCEYETVQIGRQLWMTENLKTTHYRNGDAIVTGLDNDAWASTEEGAYAIYDDDPANAEVYGNLYNWYVVDDDRGVCPEGWHIPSLDEGSSLIDYLGANTDVVGGKMKSTGSIEDSNGLWSAPNLGATNESGFTSLPSGIRSQGGGYDGLSLHTSFWSSTPYNDHAWRWTLYFNSPEISITNYLQGSGYSIRCLSDETLNTTILVPENFATIQEAIDYSIDGDTILVSAGTYYENLNISNKTVAIIGEDKNTTILDAQQGRGIMINNIDPHNFEIHNITITNGNANDGAALYLNALESAVINNCIINNNTAYNSAIRIDNIPDIVITKTLIHNNTATNSANSYGAIVTYDNVNLILDYVTLAFNIRGGVFTHEPGTNVEINNSIFWNPDASEEVGRRTSGTIITMSYSAFSSYPYCSGDYICGEGVIVDNPQFNEDYTLQPSSPCIDAGDPNSPLDPDGTIADMGAYYYHQDPAVYGCTDESACNYNSEATDDDASCTYAEENFDCDGNCISDLDCNGDCAGTAVLDNCNVCDSDTTNDCIQDCNGTWGGTAIEDECGTCDDNPNNDCFDTNMSLHSGANLKSFYALPIDKSVSNVFQTLGDNLTGVITEGGAASQIASGVWVGSLSEIEYTKGYWLITITDGILLQNDVIPTDTDIEYDLHSGANLISYPASGTQDISASLPDDIELAISGIITEGGAASQISPGFWVGSMTQFEGGKGYWVISSTNISFSFITD